DQTYSADGLTPQGLVSAYRWHLLDSIPFHEELLFVQEAGCPRKGARAGINGIEQLHYEWVCCWYQAESAAGSGEIAGNNRAKPVTI
ncbi:MAG: DUF2961 domain-containing protein, partial [Gemmatimonadetes bacterium]|nr:DUF2961 domain-containing protein [Gemmatimonadota bacterium]